MLLLNKLAAIEHNIQSHFDSFRQSAFVF